MHRIYKKTNRALLAGTTAFAVIALAYSPVALAETSNTTITGTIGSAITVSSGASVALNVSPASGPAYTTNSNTVTVTTNNSTGYNLTLMTTSAERGLVHTVNSSEKIAASSGSRTTPTALVANTWGYRVDGLSGSGFGAGPTSAVSSQPLGASLWAGVPANGGSPDNIATSNTNTSGSGDNVTVWYAMAADATKPSGNYTNSVIYTATTK